LFQQEQSFVTTVTEKEILLYASLSAAKIHQILQKEKIIFVCKNAYDLICPESI
jgi:hypothetical protein